MPRRNRFVLAGVPHHVTQRGNHRERVFLEPGDPEAYLSLFHAYSRRNGLKTFAYCLMPNHVHLVVVPGDVDAMHRTLRAVHSQFAQRINRMRGITGHLWQGRYHSSTLDVPHFLHAIRYVEQNPVRAGLTTQAEHYPWSSAAAHCGLRQDHLLAPVASSDLLAGITCWSTWLASGVPDEVRQTLQQRESRNLPCGSREFVDQLSRTSGRDLQFRSRGGQRKKIPPAGT
jgi:putative transposase